jgi:hypothetical protein
VSVAGNSVPGMDGEELQAFVVRAKAQTYAAGAGKVPGSRDGSHDLRFVEGEFAYLDSYFGGTDFLGQEVVWWRSEPVWAMNYYGHILEPGDIDAARAGRVVQASLSALYKEDRFLGGWRFEVDGDVYVDTSDGDVSRFRGVEWIERNGRRLYELEYHGGLVVP